MRHEGELSSNDLKSDELLIACHAIPLVGEGPLDGLSAGVP